MQGASAAVIVVLLVAAARWASGAATATRVPAAAKMPQRDETCMSCLCKAVGKNGTCVSDMQQTCVHLDTYGPFCISQPFWIDAGKPVLQGDDKDLPGAFKRCVEEPFCAVRTVRGYMETGPGIQDCDKNGVYNCRDLVLTHLHGRYNCKDVPDKRVTSLEKCMEQATVTVYLPKPAVAPSPRPQAPVPGGRPSASTDLRTAVGGVPPTGGGWSMNSYGSGSTGDVHHHFSSASSTGGVFRNAFGSPGFGNIHPRDTFNYLQPVPSLQPDDGDGDNGPRPGVFPGRNPIVGPKDHGLDALMKMAVDNAMNAARNMGQNMHGSMMKIPDGHTFPDPLFAESSGDSQS